jgi:hypothetical protein
MDVLSANCFPPITLSDLSSSRMLITSSLPWVRSLFRLWLAVRWSNSRRAPLPPLIRTGYPDGSAVLLRCGTLTNIVPWWCPPAYDRQFAYFVSQKISRTTEVNTCDLAGSPQLLPSALFTSHRWLHAVPPTHPTPSPMGTTGRRMAVCTARRRSFDRCHGSSGQVTISPRRCSPGVSTVRRSGRQSNR